MKLLNRKHKGLSSSEKRTAKSLLITHDDSNSGSNDQEDAPYFQQIENKHRRLDDVSKYLDCSFISANSCTAERIFSMARWMLTCLRHRMSPILFEAILFLKFSRRLWNIKTVAEGIKLGPINKYTDLDDETFYPQEYVNESS